MRLPALTGIRALAALWVVMYHFRDDVVALFPALAVLDPLVRAGYLGVDLFFVLSGFILCHTYFDQFHNGVSLPAYRRFLQARIARVYPVHFVTLHIVLLGLLAAGTLGFEIYSINGSPAAYVAQLFMAHLWLGMGSTFNYPSWSISAEWFAYLLCPLLLIGMGRLRTPAQFGAVAAVAFLGSAALLAQRTDLAETWLPRIIGGFVGGAAVNMIYRATPAFRHGPVLIWGALALFSVGIMVHGGYWFNVCD
ncbi:acyltransferase [Deinococcus sp. LM3]|uniref:acyltransferase family protein n=1 Tax=Deinococcus sp. LM3 TaxID=1938608 RepID=UPI000991FCE7|nr:acyltransferase [Deinococcus sp. LM3]OOV11361.1 hypothetical protein BXU09_20050 [Deinococcus sp. LM3]